MVSEFRSIAKTRSTRSNDRILASPSYYEVRRYTLKYQSAEDLIQAAAGYLGIQIKPAADSNPAYPKPQNTAGGSAAYAGARGVPLRLNPFTREAQSKPNRDLSPDFHSMILFRPVDLGMQRKTPYGSSDRLTR